MSLDNIAGQLFELIKASQENFVWAFLLTALLWLVHGLNLLTGHRLLYLGIIPRTLPGLIGIPLSPLLHANVQHLFLNSVPFLVLTDLILIKGEILFTYVTLSIIIISGGLTWLLARRAIHVGASGLIMGYWGYLLVYAYYQPSIVAIILAVLCLYYLGGLAMNLVIIEQGTSWEGHVFGFVGGVATVYLLPQLMLQ